MYNVVDASYVCTVKAALAPKDSAEGLSVETEPGDDARPFKTDPQQDWWRWAHAVAVAASSPSQHQEALLQQGQQMAEGLTGLGGTGAQFWSGPLQSRILSAISKLKRPRTILEIGAFVGISC